jgi:FXSXX-COOH protein
MSSTSDERPLPDVRGLNFSELDADPVLAAALRRLLADIAGDDGAISAFGSAVPAAQDLHLDQQP